MTIRPYVGNRAGTAAGLPVNEGGHLAIGSGSQAAEGAIAIGSTAPVETDSVVIGGTAFQAPSSTVVGRRAGAPHAEGAVAVGRDAFAGEAPGAVVIGFSANGNASTGAVVIGQAAGAARAERTIAIGHQASAHDAPDSIVIGAGSRATETPGVIVLGIDSAAHGQSDRVMLLGGNLNAYDCVDAVVLGRGRTLHDLPGCLVGPGPSVLPRELPDSLAADLPVHARRTALDNFLYSSEVILGAGSITFPLPPGLYLFPDEIGLIATAGGGDIDGMTVSAQGQGLSYLQQHSLTGPITDRCRFRIRELAQAAGTNSLTVTLDSGPTAGGGMGVVYVRGAVMQLA